METTNMQIEIDKKFRKHLIPQSPDEGRHLEALLRTEGCRDALVVWLVDGKRILLDGHNRYSICQKYNIPYQVIERQFESEEDAIDWIDRNQLARRNLPFDERRLLIGRIYRREKKSASDNLWKGPQNSLEAGIRPSGETLGKVEKPSNLTATEIGERYGLKKSAVKEYANRSEVYDALFDKGEEHAAEVAAKAPQRVVEEARKILRDETKPEPERVAEAAKVVTAPPEPKPVKPRAVTSNRPILSKAMQAETIKEIARLVGTLNDADYILCMKHLANTRMIDKRRSIEVVIETLHKSLPEAWRKQSQLPLFDPQPAELPLPDSIATTGVQEAWAIWCRHLKSKKIEWSCDEANLQLKQLARSKPAKVVLIIEYAIANRMTQLPLAKDVPEDFTEMEENEVITYAKTRGYPVSDARDFFLHYASQGWKKGNGQPVTNWKFQLSRWVSGQDKPTNGKSTRKNGALYVPGDEIQSGLI